jgi:uncharacterized protein YuzE
MSALEGEFIYDPKDHSFYMEFRQGVVVRTEEECNGRCIIEYDSSDNVLGIEIYVGGLLTQEAQATLRVA